MSDAAIDSRTVDRALVFLDTETATTAGSPHLLEIGAIRVVDGEVEDQFQSLVAPQVDIDPEAERIHGISAVDVRTAPPAAEVLAEFSEWLEDDWMVAHRSEFDARVLGFEYRRCSLPMPDAPLIDSLSLSRKLLPESPGHRLFELCEYLELEEGEYHRALPDAVWCWKVVEACIARMGGETVTAAALLSKSGSPVTIPRCAPGFGLRMKPRWRPLERACGNLEPVTLVYGSGAEGPARLTVVPHFLYAHKGRGYMEAECSSSGTLKTYRLDRVQRVL